MRHAYGITQSEAHGAGVPEIGGNSGPFIKLTMDNLTYFRRQNRNLMIKNLLQWTALWLFGALIVWLWMG